MANKKKFEDVVYYNFRTERSKYKVLNNIADNLGSKYSINDILNDAADLLIDKFEKENPELLKEKSK